MSKIGAYLQEHLEGEVSQSPAVREAFSRDGSSLKLKPEAVVYPRNINDVRKIARFSWQLAERGHTLALTARGSGSDTTGAAISSGVVLVFPAFMNQIFEYAPKRQLVRLQPGASVGALRSALALAGAYIPALDSASYQTTIGGAVANNERSILSGRYGRMDEWVDQLEVVLSNGEVIQTERLSRKELDKRKGLGTLEGEIYRSLDNLIEDNLSAIEALQGRSNYTNAGFSAVAKVKRKDGSFDLTPLFIGSQGSLGIITEMIIKTTAMPKGLSLVVSAFEEGSQARDAVESIIKQKPAFIEYYETKLFMQAIKKGAKYDFINDSGYQVEAIIAVGFDDESDRTRNNKAKKLQKSFEKAGFWADAVYEQSQQVLAELREALIWTASSDGIDFTSPSILGAVHVPTEQIEIYLDGVKTIAAKYEMALPVYGEMLAEVFYVWPELNLKRPGDKQKMLKMLDDYAYLLQKVEGELIASGGEGRLKGRFALIDFNEKTTQLYSEIKKIFDPYDILNPGVKQPLEIKQIIPMLQSDFQLLSPDSHLPNLR